MKAWYKKFSIFTIRSQWGLKEKENNLKIHLANEPDNQWVIPQTELSQAVEKDKTMWQGCQLVRVKLKKEETRAAKQSEK